ncbi:heme peroxidase [Actinomycetospora sp. TBRC 11914]|nr:heme peroxidase [Actinomycetospora sp. TBRC 11914]
MAPIRPHGQGVRGLGLARTSKIFGGRFGRIFRAIPPADFGPTDDASQAALTKLGAAMSAAPDPVKDGPDAEESGVPAVFTYFGQFIDHDLTFDPVSSLQRQNDPEALVDFRTPRFDLDSVYGRGPDDQPYLYDGSGRRFLLGDRLTGKALSVDLSARDLVRSGGNPARAVIGDPRNDENVIVSQLQGLVLRLHNAIADDNPGLSFAEVQRETRFHYQWVVLNDFLPTLISKDVIAAVLPHIAAGTSIADDRPVLGFYHSRDDAFMPLEFSVAAYRFGHSMVRPGYRLNDDIAPIPIFPPVGAPSFAGLGGFDRFPSTWAIDWARFADLEERPVGKELQPGQTPGTDEIERTQLAYRIDTALVDPLAHLPASVAGDPPPSLAQRNLLRGWRLRLPSGQAVARAMGVVPKPDGEIKIGKFTGDPADIVGDVVTVGGTEFAGNCPLWAYVLAETVEEDRSYRAQGAGGTNTVTSRVLGPVGGRIVAETMAGLLEDDSSSFLNVDPRWTPSLAVNGVFGLRELVAAAIKKPV